MLFYTPPVEWPSHLGPDLVSASRTRASTTQGARTAIERRLRTQSRPPQPRARLACSCHDRAQPLRRRRAPCAPQRRASTVASSRRVYNFSCRPRPAASWHSVPGRAGRERQHDASTHRAGAGQSRGRARTHKRSGRDDIRQNEPTRRREISSARLDKAARLSVSVSSVVMQSKCKPPRDASKERSRPAGEARDKRNAR